MIDERPHLLADQPVLVVRTLDHNFTRGQKAVRGGKTQFVCAICGYVKGNVIHHAFPRSFNTFGSGSRKAYQGAKDAWAGVFDPMLESSDLERGMGGVRVEGICTFGERTHRRGHVPDQENYRYPLSKFLADRLVAGGYIEDDSWFCFQFGDLAYRYEQGLWRLDLAFFPSIEQLARD